MSWHTHEMMASEWCPRKLEVGLEGKAGALHFFSIMIRKATYKVLGNVSNIELVLTFQITLIWKHKRGHCVHEQNS